jgi:tetratricopeptide (TPR) repeat protein
MWRGEFGSAAQLADRATARVSVVGDPLSYWRFRLLSCELAILTRDFTAAERTLTARLPDGPAFDALRARQRLLEAKLQIEQGNIRAGHEALARARALGVSDSDVALEIDRLDGQALLRLSQWSQGDEMLNRVLDTSERLSDRYHQAMALNDLGMGRIARNRYDEALPYFERVISIPEARSGSIYAAALKPRARAISAWANSIARCHCSSVRSPCRKSGASASRSSRRWAEMGNLYALRANPRKRFPICSADLMRPSPQVCRLRRSGLRATSPASN